MENFTPSEDKLRRSQRPIFLFLFIFFYKRTKLLCTVRQGRRFKQTQSLIRQQFVCWVVSSLNFSFCEIIHNGKNDPFTQHVKFDTSNNSVGMRSRQMRLHWKTKKKALFCLSRLVSWFLLFSVFFFHVFFRFFEAGNKSSLRRFEVAQSQWSHCDICLMMLIRI